MTQYATIDEIKAATTDKYFFTGTAKRVFQSRILEGVYGGCYFITSEREKHQRMRRYTIRMINERGAIMKVGEMQQYATREQAIAAVKKLVREQAKGA